MMRSQGYGSEMSRKMLICPKHKCGCHECEHLKPHKQVYANTSTHHTACITTWSDCPNCVGIDSTKGFHSMSMWFLRVVTKKEEEDEED